MRVKAKLLSNMLHTSASFSSNTINTSASFINRITVSDIRTQGKEIIPTEGDQVIVPDEGYQALNQVIVRAIPSNYGRIVWNGTSLKVY